MKYIMSNFFKIFFLSQGLRLSKLASSLLHSQRRLWTSDPSASALGALGLHACTTMFSFMQFWGFSPGTHKSRPKPPKTGWLKMRYLAASGGMGMELWWVWIVSYRRMSGQSWPPLLHTGTLRCQSVDQEQSSPNTGPASTFVLDFWETSTV